MSPLTTIVDTLFSLLRPKQTLLFKRNRVVRVFISGLSSHIIPHHAPKSTHLCDRGPFIESHRKRRDTFGLSREGALKLPSSSFSRRQIRYRFEEWMGICSHDGRSGGGRGIECRHHWFRDLHGQTAVEVPEIDPRLQTPGRRPEKT